MVSMKFIGNKTAALLLFCLSVLLIAGCKDYRTLKVTYFFASQCNDCEDAGEMLKKTKTKFSHEEQPVRLDIKLYNILSDEGWDVLMETLERTAVPATSQHMPLLFIGDNWYYGEEDIMGAVEDLAAHRIPAGIKLTSTAD